MTIELFNSLLTAGVPVKVQTEQMNFNLDLIKRIQGYYRQHGAPSTDQIDRQNKRVQEHCKTVKNG